MPKLKFSVDSALLRELGERLVGQPHIALAELVKNSYDADATAVTIRFFGDEIEVIDNGHGMDFREFSDYWMRIGSPHKDDLELSRTLKRPLTGSKGVGRLSAQFLANALELNTVPKKRDATELVAELDWRQAIRTGDLTEVEVVYRLREPATRFAQQSRHGTRIRMSKLNHAWSESDFRDLARQIRTLQPPFRPNPRLESDEQRRFEVALETDNEQLLRAFQEQMEALLNIWTARIVSKRDERESSPNRTSMRLTLEFADGDRQRSHYSIEGGRIHLLEFEIRVFNLVRRQPEGVRVADAREYFNEFGGVHVYDAGFHLPYYGPKSDWLQIEMDHSHRLSTSKLLPGELQVAGGLSFLPTNSRLFGVVNIDTAYERRKARDVDHLAIQVTRDRLVENRAYAELRDAVRWALDFYAMREAQRQFEEAELKRPALPAIARTRNLNEVLKRHRGEMPRNVYETVKREIDEAVAASESETEFLRRQVGLLGSLATAGMVALAYEHEAHKQMQMIERIYEGLSSTTSTVSRADVRGTAERLGRWLERARGTRALFAHLLDAREREKRRSLRARQVIENVIAQTKLFLRGVETDVEINSELLLPPATYAEWVSIFQNIFINAANAMVDAEPRRLRIRSFQSASAHVVEVADTGIGVELPDAETLFRPFVRAGNISPARTALGFGGSGLGLTIVRLLAENIGCEVAFTEPPKGYATAIRLSWRRTDEDRRG